MEILADKMDLQVTCPHCNITDTQIFYINASTLSCNFCNKDFNISLYVDNIKVVTSK